MKRLYRFLGSLPMAVMLLVLLAAALAFGTLCETNFGTPAAQHYFYRAPWFQMLLVFLCLNLLISALRRAPWGKRHIGFLMTHLGIILILIGNLIGIWFSVEGTLLIPEGQTEKALALPRDVLWVQPENPGTPISFPLGFSTRPWIHDVRKRFSIDLEGASLEVTVDRYLPNAILEEDVVVGGEEFPAILLELTAPRQVPQRIWLFSRDPERFGFRWGPAHVLFFELRNEKELFYLEHPEERPGAGEKGTLRLDFFEENIVREIPVATFLGKRVPIEGTPYTLHLKDYFPDFIISAEGPATRSDQPHNPAVSFTVKGPEGEDPFLVFAHHPEFEERHGVRRTIPVRATLDVDRIPPSLPPGLVGIVRTPETWRVLMTSPEGEARKILPFSLNEHYTHPWFDLSFRVLERISTAQVVRKFRLKDNEVKRQAIHVLVERDGEKNDAWMGQGDASHFTIGGSTVALSYQPATQELPFSVRLVDFRKMEYPGTTVPSGFESDLEILDPTRGLHLSRTISMNNPLTYRGYTMFQSSYIEGPMEATVLSVRKDQGTPVVYAGFITVVLGIILMFTGLGVRNG